MGTQANWLEENPALQRQLAAEVSALCHGHLVEFHQLLATVAGDEDPATLHDAVLRLLGDVRQRCRRLGRHGKLDV